MLSAQLITAPVGRPRVILNLFPVAPPRPISYSLKQLHTTLRGHCMSFYDLPKTPQRHPKSLKGPERPDNTNWVHFIYNLGRRKLAFLFLALIIEHCLFIECSTSHDFHAIEFSNGRTGFPPATLLFTTADTFGTKITGNGARNSEEYSRNSPYLSVQT